MKVWIKQVHSKATQPRKLELTKRIYTTQSPMKHKANVISLPHIWEFGLKIFFSELLHQDEVIETNISKSYIRLTLEQSFKAVTNGIHESTAYEGMKYISKTTQKIKVLSDLK